MATIRLATVKDIKSIIAFRKQGNIEGEYINNRPTEQIRNDIVGLEYTYILALKGQEVVGQIMLRKLTTRNVLFISHIAILNSEKGSGLANELMDKAKSYMLKLKCSSLELVVNTKNKRAIAFYEKQGFKLNGSNSKRSLTYTYDNVTVESVCLFSLW